MWCLYLKGQRIKFQNWWMGTKQSKKVRGKQTQMINKILKQNVIQKCESNDARAVFAFSISKPEGGISTGRAFIKKCIYKVFIVMNISHCPWFAASRYESVKASNIATKLSSSKAFLISNKDMGI